MYLRPRRDIWNIVKKKKISSLIVKIVAMDIEPIFLCPRYIRVVLFLLVLSVSVAEDYYELLKLKRDATQKQIRQAFKKLAVTHHPDKNNVCKKFMLLEIVLEK